MPRLKGTYNIPDWALCPLEYGINSDEYGLTDEDIAQIKDFQENVIGGGYYMDIHWEDCTNLIHILSLDCLQRHMRLIFILISYDETN